MPKAKDMSLRDHFAGLAMQALQATHKETPDELIAVWAYQQADAMLKARVE